MNENSKKKAGIAFLAAALSLAVISAVLRVVNIFFFFDSDIGYYQSGAALPIISNILLAVGAAFFAVFAFCFFRRSKTEYFFASPAETAASVIAAISAFLLVAADILSVIRGQRLGLLTGALSVMCSLYFICALVHIKPIYKILAGILTIARLTFMLGASYFNQYVQMNAPDKILFGLACVFAMLFIASELKVFVGTVKTPIYLISAALTTVFSATSAIPSIIAVHAGKLPEGNGMYAEYYLLFGLAVYAGVRLTVSMLNIIKDKKAEVCETEADCEE